MKFNSVQPGQDDQDVIVNENFETLDAYSFLGRDPDTTSLLTWGYYGGYMMIDGVLSLISDGTKSLTGSSTNYMEVNRSGTVAVNTTGFTAGSRPLYQITTNGTGVTAYIDYRNSSRPFSGRLALDVAGSSNITLTAAQARCDIIEMTGTLTGNINIIVPTVAQQWTIFNNSAGAYTITVKTSGGSGIAITQGKKLIVYCNGTDVLAALDDVGALSGSPVGRHLVPIMASGMLPTVTAGCASLNQVETTAGRPDVISLDFDATTMEHAQFYISMPPSWNEGTITFRVRWGHGATTTNFGVVWGLQAVAVGNDDTMDVAFGTAQEVTDTGGTTEKLYDSPESSALTIGGSPAAGDLVCFDVYRKPADGSDTMAVDARLVGVDLYITTDAGTDA